MYLPWISITADFWLVEDSVGWKPNRVDHVGSPLFSQCFKSLTRLLPAKGIGWTYGKYFNFEPPHDVRGQLFNHISVKNKSEIEVILR